ncbi:unnamed protein product [Caenorhabditis angaria]|uniref:Uncharacterized protein n=1 Tax=Caenorhabditis angaria TaxID=860376 RepID=A0A9P1IG77_9PELO|nr:unnamed protein product [Caenorhabditis angaria]
MNNPTVRAAQIQIKVLDLEDEVEFLRSENIMHKDENEDLTAQLEVLKKTSENEKIEALEDQSAEHEEAIFELRQDHKSKTLDIVMSRVLDELTSARVPEARIQHFLKKKRMIEAEIADVLNVSERRPNKVGKRKLQREFQRRNEQHHEEVRKVRNEEREKIREDVLWEAEIHRELNKAKRQRLEHLIEVATYEEQQRAAERARIREQQRLEEEEEEEEEDSEDEFAESESDAEFEDEDIEVV